MNNVNLDVLENKKIELLKSYELDSDSIQKFRSQIKQVSQEESDELGKKLYDLISFKLFDDNGLVNPHNQSVIKLITSGANVEYKDENKGNFPLLICARKNYFQAFIKLLTAGANVNQVNDYMTTALMASARHGFKEMTQILILMGADINARCLDGDNAIMSAARHGQKECFNILLNAQAYLNNRNLIAETILDIKKDINIDLSMIKDESMLGKMPSITEQDTMSLINEAEQKMKKLTY